MIRHIVLFKIKDEYKSEIPQLVKNFYGMKGKIEGMTDLEAGADFLGSERSYDLALITVFEDRASFDAYPCTCRSRSACTRCAARPSPAITSSEKARGGCAEGSAGLFARGRPVEFGHTADCLSDEKVCRTWKQELPLTSLLSGQFLRLRTLSAL